MQLVIWNLSAHAFSLFSLGSDGEGLRCLIVNVHATGYSQKRNYFSHRKKKAVGLKGGSVKWVYLKMQETGRCFKLFRGLIRMCLL